ncbi:hypothetical protein [Streptomyces sp. NPDC096033]|uniref:hypothetical protein n=1 Tax=Streptomyces sp. NPDC096033 TaxID=3366071 RepID=UPI0038237843
MSIAAERHPHLSVVPPMPAQPPAPLEGVVIEKTKTVEKAARPSWLGTAVNHAKDNYLYLPLAGHGLGQAWGNWLDGYHDDYKVLIGNARQESRLAPADKQKELKKHIRDLRADYLRHRLTYTGVTAAWAAAGGTGLVTATATGLWWVDIAAVIGIYLNGLRHGISTKQPTALPAAEDPTTARVIGSQFVTSPGATAVPAQGGVTPQGVTAEQLPADTKPFPVRQVNTPEELATCVLAAMRKNSVPVAEVFDISHQPWGWQCTVRVSEGTPEAIIKAAGGLETSFDLGTNRLRIQPLKERRACATLRLIEGDPFASAPAPPHRAPKSISITDRSRIGTSIGGDPLDLSLAGVMGLFVAASGGGKTGILQSLGEVATACRDNITIDLDPFGDGLEDLHDAVRITARTTEQIEAVLAFLLVLAKARARLRRKLGMGNKWRPSPEHPAITAIFDEFPKASELSQLLTVELQLVGRKECIEVEIAAQGGTSRYLSENIAQMIALRMVGPCKRVDTNAVFGDGAAAEGWLPHRLDPATDTDPKDAGHVFVQGVPGLADSPVEYAIHHFDAETLRKLAAERLEAGLVELDQESIAAMADVDLPDIPGFPELLSWSALLRLCGARPPAGHAATHPIVAEALAVMDERGVDRMRTETLAAALHLTVDELKAKLRAAGVPDPSGIGPTEGLQNPRGYKRETLASA